MSAEQYEVGLKAGRRTEKSDDVGEVVGPL